MLKIIKRQRTEAISVRCRFVIATNVVVHRYTAQAIHDESMGSQ